MQWISRFVRVLAFAGIALLGLKTIAQSKSVATKVNETSFRLTLPGAWEAGDESDPTKRVYHTDHEQLTVSIFGPLIGSAGSTSHEDRVSRFKIWVKKRIDLEAKLSDHPGVIAKEPLYGESRGTLAARYEGFDSGYQRRFHCMILARSSAFEAFYYEAVGMSEQAAEDRAKTIFNSVDIPK